MQHWNRHSISGDMERVNHLHMVVQSDDIEKSMKAFKQYTAKELLSLLKKENVKTILDQLQFYKKAHHKATDYQVWEEGYQPSLVNNVSKQINQRADNLPSDMTQKVVIDVRGQNISFEQQGRIRQNIIDKTGSNIKPEDIIFKQ